MQWIPSKALREAKEYKQELDTYLREMIEERRKGIDLGEERPDLLSSLVKANNAEIKEKSESGFKEETMNLDELSGNLFMFLVAGHETSE
jgi:cytochrome P450